MVSMHFVEAQVRKEFAALQRPGLRYEEERDFSWGHDILRIRVSWKSGAVARRHVGVSLDFTRKTVRTQPRMEPLDLGDRHMAWIAALIQAVPPSGGQPRGHDAPALSPGAPVAV